MDVRFIAWAGYQFDATGAEESSGFGCPPEFTSEDIGELQIKGTNLTDKAKVSGKDLKPSIVAYPQPTV